MRVPFVRLLILFFLVAGALSVHASETEGTISLSDKYAWGENTGWINFAPTNGDAYAGLTITDSAVTGYAWTKEFGWINFSPTNSGQGVMNTEDGHLSGKAWIAALGWLDMSGVTINSSGRFTGIAGVEGGTVGRVSFDCENCNVTTDWRPLSARTVADEDINGSSGGGSIPQNNVAAANGATPSSGGKTLPATGNSSSDKKINIPGNSGDPIRDLYNALKLTSPDRTPGSDYVESYGAPLTIQPDQRGLLAYGFPNGASIIIRIPKGASDGPMTIEVSTASADADLSSGAVYVFGGITFTVIAKDAHGNLIHNFSHPLEITLGVPATLSGEKDLGVYWLDVSTNEWVLIPAVTFLGTTATFSVDHLTEFVILKANGLPSRIAASVIMVKAFGQNHFKYWLLFLLLVIVFYLYFRDKKKHKHAR